MKIVVVSGGVDMLYFSSWSNLLFSSFFFRLRATILPFFSTILSGIPISPSFRRVLSASKSPLHTLGHEMESRSRFLFQSALLPSIQILISLSFPCELRWRFLSSRKRSMLSKTEVDQVVMTATGAEARDVLDMSFPLVS